MTWKNICMIRNSGVNWYREIYLANSGFTSKHAQDKSCDTVITGEFS